MQTEIIEQIIHLPIAERVEIIEKISRSVKEDLNEIDAEEKNFLLKRERRLLTVCAELLLLRENSANR